MVLYHGREERKGDNVKPYYEASEQNKAPILEALRQLFVEPGLILEIGSGTGQHVVHFARHLPHLAWLPTDIPEQLPGIRLWVEEAALANIREPLALDVAAFPWPVGEVDGVYSANTAHIMHWPQVEAMFRGVGQVLKPGGLFCLYGPFQYGGEHTSPSNARFHASLQARDPGMGVRDVEELNQIAATNGLVLARDLEMPVNNRTLVWQKAVSEGG